VWSKNVVKSEKTWALTHLGCLARFTHCFSESRVFSSRTPRKFDTEKMKTAAKIGKAAKTSKKTAARKIG
jgi:hypothetical protein